MVSIKSLAVLLFAAAVTAAPLAGGENHGEHHDEHHDEHHGGSASQSCPRQDQELYCCNDNDKTAHFGPYTSILDNVEVNCNNVHSNVWAVSGVTGQSACNAKAACCTGKTNQNGPVNLALDCIAFAGN